MENVNPVLGVGGHGADVAESDVFRWPGPVFNYLVCVLSASYSSQSDCLLLSMVRFMEKHRYHTTHEMVAGRDRAIAP